MRFHWQARQYVRVMELTYDNTDKSSEAIKTSKAIFKKMMDDAEDLVEEHDDSIKGGIDKAAEFADDKTGGKYSEHIETGKDKAHEVIDDLAEEG